MKNIRYIVSTKNKPRNKVIMFSLALGLLAIVTTNAISPLELVKPAMAKKLIATGDIADNAVTSPKIKDGEVKTSDIADGTITSPKIKDGEVKTSDIADGTITGDDVSTGFMIRKTLHDDDAGHALGWDPSGIRDLFEITDSDISGPAENILIDININTFGSFSVCNVSLIDTTTHDFFIRCTGFDGGEPPAGSTLNYIITKLPSNVVTSTASASSTSSLTPTISSPFSSLEGH